MEWLEGCRNYEEPSIDFETFFGTEDTLAGSDSDHGFSPSPFLSLGGILECSSSFTDSTNDLQGSGASHSAQQAMAGSAPSSDYMVIPSSNQIHFTHEPPIIMSCPTNFPMPKRTSSKPSSKKAKVVRRKRLLLKAMKDLPKPAYDELTVMGRKEMRLILDYNGQNTEGNKSDLMVRITDCYLRGALPLCPSCNLPGLVESNTNTFFCTTQLAGGYVCDYHDKAVIRTAWKVRSGHAI